VNGPESYEWGAAAVAELRALWAEGVSTTEIGRRMGASKNAVVGKAHRLKLDARPSPIRAKGAGCRPKRQSKRVGIVSYATSAAPPTGFATYAERGARADIILPRQPEPEAKPIIVVEPPALSDKQCAWLFDKVGGVWLQCECKAQIGKPYCPEHCAAAFVPARKMGDAKQKYLGRL
jgi:GcrA cell cycle regulator